MNKLEGRIISAVGLTCCVVGMVAGLALANLIVVPFGFASIYFGAQVDKYWMEQ